MISGSMPDGYSSYLKIHRAWKECAGDAMSFLTTPGSIKDGILTVAVHDQTWLAEIGFLKGELIHRLNQAGVQVSNINFYYKHKKQPGESGNEQPRKPMTEKEKKFADRLVDTIDNDDLKKAFRKALYAYFTLYTLDDYLNC